MSKVLAFFITPLIILFLSFVLGQFSFVIPTQFYDVFEALFGFLGIFGFIVPLDELQTVIGLATQFTLVVYSFLGGMWLFRLLIKGFHG